jgi:ectoine hydroxylase-related dioxygenase (phytanoyl-CoA dioxygenase family)
MGALTQEQIDFFFEHGYISIGKVLKDEEVSTYRTEYDREFATSAGRNLAVGDGDEAAGKAPQKRMLQITQMCERNLHFRRLLYDSRILDMAESLIGPNIMLFHDQALYKPARHGGAVFWHQDNSYWKCKPANLVSCWMTFDDVDRDNGAMQVIPGSHLRPVHHEISPDTNRLQEIKGVEEHKAKVVDLPAGGCMFHHCQTLHYTAPNTTKRQRRAFAIHFMPFGTTGREGETLRAGFNHPVLRMRA